MTIVCLFFGSICCRLLLPSRKGGRGDCFCVVCLYIGAERERRWDFPSKIFSFLPPHHYDGAGGGRRRCLIFYFIWSISFSMQQQSFVHLSTDKLLPTPSFCFLLLLFFFSAVGVGTETSSTTGWSFKKEKEGEISGQWNHLLSITDTFTEREKERTSVNGYPLSTKGKRGTVCLYCCSVVGVVVR